MYVTPPYKDGGIEKAEVNLMDFAKTRTLAPGESQVLTLQCVAQDFASFDWNDVNDNGFIGYELEAGNYTVSLRKNSHDEVLSVQRSIATDIECANDYTTGNKIEAVFSQTSGYWAEFNSVNKSLEANMMSRATGLELPKTATVADRIVDQAMIDQILGRYIVRANEDDENDYWYVAPDGIPEGWDQSTTDIEWKKSPGGQYPTYHRADVWYAERTNPEEAKTEIQLADMAGIPYQDYKLSDDHKVIVGTDEGSKTWEKFMNQLTWDELVQIVSNGGHGRMGVDSIGLPWQTDLDGATQMSCFFGYSSYAKWVGDAIGPGTVFPAGAQIAVTWNKELAYEIGRAMGNECLLLDYDGLYGYSCNTHRSPFGGRNYEYYSEDGVLAGMLVGNATLGTTEKGVVVFTKHIFLNEQEKDRGSVLLWCTEQAMREIYLKPYEFAIKYGHANGIMNSMSRIGTVKVYVNGALHDGILHNEWDFKGITLTDAGSGNNYAQVADGVRNGVDIPLGAAMGGRHNHEPSKWNPDKKTVMVSSTGAYDGTAWFKNNVCDIDNLTLDAESNTTYYTIRRAALHILYVSANSCGMKNGIRDSYDIEITRSSNNTSVSITAQQLLSDYDISRAEFDLGDLPESVKLTVQNGKLVITAMDTEHNRNTIAESTIAAGTYTVKIKCLVDNRIGLVREDENGELLGYYYSGANGTVYFAPGELGHRQEITLNITIK